MKKTGLTCFSLALGIALFVLSSGLAWAVDATDTFLGTFAGGGTTSGTYDTYIGYAAGASNISGTGNVFLGHGACYSELESNKLYIDNCYISPLTCDTPLIYGEFDNHIVRIDGTLIMGPPPVMISDGRLKQDIEPLKSSLEKITRLGGVSFNWKPEKKNYAKGFGGKKQFGLIAQEVEAVFPEMVYTDAKGLKAVAYDKLGPLVIEAKKGQEKKIEEKDARIERLEKALAAMEWRLASLENPIKTVAIK